MTLERALTFTDKSDISEYLDANVFNRELYKAYIENKDNYYRWKSSPLTTFNEVYYQCVRVYNDPVPESEVYVKYLNDAKATLGTRYASDMVFSMVNAVFEIMDNKPSNVEYFQMELKAYFKNEQCYYQQYLDFAKKFMDEFGKQSFVFKYCPVAPAYLRHDHHEWQAATDDFDEFKIRQFVARYSSTADRLALVEKIREAYDRVEAENDELENMSDLPF